MYFGKFICILMYFFVYSWGWNLGPTFVVEKHFFGRKKTTFTKTHSETFVFLMIFTFFPNSGVYGDRVLVGFKENLSPLGLTPNRVFLCVNLVSSRDLACLRRHTSFLLKMDVSGSESDKFLVVSPSANRSGIMRFLKRSSVPPKTCGISSGNGRFRVGRPYNTIEI